MHKKLVVVATVTAHPGKEKELRTALQTLVPHARTEHGFVQYDLHVAQDEPGDFLFYEIWEDVHALDAHSKSDFSKIFGAEYGHLIKAATLKKYTLI